MMKRRFVIGLVTALLVTGGIIWAYGRRADTSSATPAQRKTATPPPAVKTSSEPDSGFSKSAQSLTEPASIWVIVNKHRPLQPPQYVPADLTTPNIDKRGNITMDERQVRTATADALQRMFAAAKTEGVSLQLQSGYRSYGFQVNLYDGYVRQQGQAVADTQSARPGHSEHQTGLAADIGGTSKSSCNVEACFAETVEGKWLTAHAYEYGFIIRYPADKTAVTGYTYEPWHARYVGTDLAAEMHRTNVTTLEEFFGTGSAPDYK